MEKKRFRLPRSDLEVHLRSTVKERERERSLEKSVESPRSLQAKFHPWVWVKRWVTAIKLKKRMGMEMAESVGFS